MFREFLEERYRKKFESEYHLTNEDAELLARFFQRKETLPESNEPDHPNHMELLDLQKAQVLSVMTPLERAKRHSKRLADNVDVWVICGILVVAFAGLVAWSIDTPGRGVRPSYDRLAIDGDPPERDAFDEFAARLAAEASLAEEGYDFSYGCTDDCSGHEAGWSWRAENGFPVENPSTYGTSNSFAEGAMAFEESVEARVEEMREEYEQGLLPY